MRLEPTLHRRGLMGGIVVHDAMEVEIGGRLVIDQRMWAKGTRSGINIDQRFAMLYIIRPEDKKIVHAELLPDTATAISKAESPPSRLSARGAA